MRTAADYYLVEEIHFALIMKADTARLFDLRCRLARWTVDER